MLLVLFVVGCASTPTPVPTVEPTTVPTLVPPPTQAPTNTPLPPTPTPAPPTSTPPPTNTPIPSSPTPTATNTRPPVTAAPTQPPATPTETAVPLRFGAPELVEPSAGQIHRAGTEDLVFSWRPVGALGGNECYLLQVRITNNVDEQYAEQSYLAACGNPGDNPLVKFTLNRKAPAPDYAGLMEIATAKTPANNFKVTWTATVVQNNGADPLNPDPALYAPLSPTSAPNEFELQG